MIDDLMEANICYQRIVVVEGLKNDEIDGRTCTELGVQVEGSSTLPDPEASVMKSLAKEEELMDEVGTEMEAES